MSMKKLAKANIDGDKMKARKIAKPMINKSVAVKLNKKAKVDIGESTGEKYPLPDPKDPLAIPKNLQRKRPVGGPMKVIQFKIFGGKNVKKSFTQTFASSVEARKYWLAFKNKRHANFSNDGTVATFPGSTDSIVSNMPIDEIVAGDTIPTHGLPDIFGPNERVIAMSSRPASDSSPKLTPHKAIARSNGKLVALKTICSELEVDPRAARMKLRKAVTNKEKYPNLAASHAANARWEWEAGSPALEEVKACIGG